MIQRPFGSTGVDVSAIGQGTWKLKNARTAEHSIRVGIELGMTHIDTAELYTGSEDVLAPVLRDHRDRLFLVSKVLPQHGSRKGVQSACEASLRRLRTDHLDVYLLHWKTDDYPLAETIGALESLVDQGKTRFIGVSNFDVDELAEARALAKRHPIVCNQVLYHLGDRGIENGLTAACAAAKVAVVAYSPFGSGDFPPGGRRGRAVLEGIAKRHGKTIGQVALDFLVRHESVFAIPKSESEEHVRENAGAAGWELTPEDLQAIDEAFPRPDAGEPLGML